MQFLVILGVFCSLFKSTLSFGLVTFFDEPAEPSYSLGSLLADRADKDVEDKDLSVELKKFKPEELSLSDRQILALPDADFFNYAMKTFSPEKGLLEEKGSAFLLSLPTHARTQAVLGTFRGFSHVTPDIFAAAKNLLQYDGDDVQFLFLGRTPSWVMYAAKAIAIETGKWRNNFFQVSFSGTPDSTSSFRLGQIVNSQFNIVTPKRLQVFEQYLDLLGLKNPKSKIYIVDMVGSGMSLNSFLRILRHYYAGAVESKKLDIQFLALNYPREGGECFDKKLLPSAKIERKGPNHFELTFQKTQITPKSLSPLKIDFIPLGIPPRTMNFLDSSFKSRWTSGAEFYACQWTEKNLGEILTKHAPLFQKIHDEIFKPAILSTLKSGPASEINTICPVCLKNQDLKGCSKCQKVKYCGRECQTNDWPRHKLECPILANPSKGP